MKQNEKAVTGAIRNGFNQNLILDGESKGFDVYKSNLKAKIYQQLFAEKVPVVAEQVQERTKTIQSAVMLTNCQGCGKAKAFSKMSRRCASVCKVCIASLEDKTPSERNRFFAKVQINIIKNLKGAFV